MLEFALGVAASLAAGLIVALAVRIRTGVTLSWANLRLLWMVTKLLRQAGVVGFYPNRSAYVRNRRQHTIGEYVATAHHDLVYVGFWLAGGTEIENVLSAFRRMVSQGRRIDLVLLDPEMDDDFAVAVARYVGIEPTSLRQRLQAAWHELEMFRSQLTPTEASRVQLKAHSEHITASAFVFDLNTRDAKTLADFKLFGIGREGSFGIELRPTTMDGDLYERVTKSFVAVRDGARFVPVGSAPGRGAARP